MNSEKALLIQAYLDGELSGRRKRKVQNWIQTDPEARAMHAQLEATRQWLLPGNELSVPVPVSRELYWAGIQSKIEKTPLTAPSIPWWRSLWVRVGAPLAGAAALVLLTLSNPQPVAPVPGEDLFFHEIEAASEARVFSYYAASAGMMVVWVDTTGN